MNNMKKPKIRFKGFTDDWEQRKLGDLYTERNERGNGSLQILSVSIHTGVSDGELDVDNLGKFVRRSEDKSTYKHVHSGDLIFNMMRAWQGAIGVAKTEGMISPAYISAIPSEDIYPPFMNYLLRRKDVINQINNLSYGVTDFRKRLYWNSFVQVNCKLPSVEEQRNITDVFEKIDHLITLHQSKAESWKNKENQLSTISWEQRKVGDITIESTEYTTLDAGYPLLTSSRAGLMYQNEYRGNLTTDSKETLFSVVPIGACTYRHMSDDDVFHLNINTLEKGLVSREYPVFFATKENCLNFIIQYINSSASFRAFCAEQKKGGTRTRLYYNALCEFKMMVPSKREQEVIAGYFLSLDHLITLHHRKLNRTQICINRSFIYGSF